MSDDRKISIACSTPDLESFRRLADRCVDLGITHVNATNDLPRAHWQWDAVDRECPYPNWNMHRAGFFKIATPAALEPWFPADYAERCMEIVRRRGEVLRERGLKAWFNGAEPMYLPNEAYEEHPEWRGPRVQMALRATRNYWAPCIDNEEVLEMYRESARELCRAAPFERFSFLTNDSAAGICWHPGLERYAGVNGPERCEDRDLEARIDGFMEAIQAGARDAGLDADVSIAGRRAVAGEERPLRQAGIRNYYYHSNTFPVVEIPQPVSFAEDLEALFAEPEADWQIGVPSLGHSAAFDLLERFREDPARDARERAELLHAVAAEQAGSDAAPALARAWERIDDAVDSLAHLHRGGPILLLGTVNQRWLVRPLVPFPLRLDESERAYYREFQFQAREEEKAADLMDLQSTYLVHGRSATKIAETVFDRATTALSGARDALAEAIPETEGAGRQSLEALDLRLQALALVVNNARYTAQYQEFLDRFRIPEQYRPDRERRYTVPEDGLEIVEADLQNTRALIDLLESSAVPLLATASNPEGLGQLGYPEEEDVFAFGTDLVDQLHRKIEITHRHLADHERLGKA